MRIKHILGYTAVGAMGVVVGYKLAYLKAEKHFDEVFNREMEAMADHIYGGEIQDVPEEKVDEVIIEPSPGHKKVVKDNTDYTKYHKEDLTTTVKHILKDIDSAELVMPEEEVEHVNLFDKMHAFDFLDEEEFMVAIGDNPVLSLTYYDEDNILADGMGIVEAAWTIGQEAFDVISSEGGLFDTDTVYVLNKKNDLYYEVIMVSASYQQSVLGLGMEDGDL